jgi:signal transduction histidine kinase
MFALIVGLWYFLRKTIQNDRKLRQAETQNLQLTEQLHETQRQLMTTEKLAVMGQLTASFAHEIGTPLTAIGGHLALLKDELPNESKSQLERVDVIDGQLQKIADIVKSFLQNTAKPPSQRQLVDLNQIADKTLRIVKPRTDALGVEVKRSYDRNMGPIRVVPLDLEQILLNLMNNSLDSIRSKGEKSRAILEVGTDISVKNGKQWAEIFVYDTGEGIKKADLGKVLKPFFTTKPPGEGTGLGLAICQQLAHKYGGHLEIDSKESHWTRVMIRLPFQANV